MSDPASIEKKIEELENEMARTQKNKATNYREFAFKYSFYLSRPNSCASLRVPNFSRVSIGMFRSRHSVLSGYEYCTT